MQFLALVAAALASTVSACVAGEGGATCVTSGGAWLYMISPYSNSTLTAGGQINIVWDKCGSDPAFDAANITFEIADASNPNNVQSVNGGQLSQPAAVSGLAATYTIPANFPAGNKYTIKSSYRDAKLGGWRNCFGNTFAIASSTPVNTAPATTTKSSGAVAGVAAAAAAAVVLAL
ncbi:hypothetical protein HDU79_011212 [Rhizoclosmatium sp. JEL0117]|nr:hypothetical protein HDU79_011212 [Rhizoclosmatium sp. JEL0117]